MEGRREELAFVAIKNGQHNSVGYYCDTGAAPGDLPARFPLADLPARIAAALGAEWQSAKAEAAE